MDQVSKLLWKYVDDDRAATAIEYGLIAGIISIAIAMVAMQIGVTLQVVFEKAANF